MRRMTRLGLAESAVGSVSASRKVALIPIIEIIRSLAISSSTLKYEADIIEATLFFAFRHRWYRVRIVPGDWKMGQAFAVLNWDNLDIPIVILLRGLTSYSTLILVQISPAKCYNTTPCDG